MRASSLSPLPAELHCTVYGGRRVGRSRSRQMKSTFMSRGYEFINVPRISAREWILFVVHLLITYCYIFG